jgi:hypothetical protein
MPLLCNSIVGANVKGRQTKRRVRQVYSLFFVDQYQLAVC